MRRVPPRQPELTACSPSSGLCCCLLCHEPPSFWGPTTCLLLKDWEELWLPRRWFETVLNCSLELGWGVHGLFAEPTFTGFCTALTVTIFPFFFNTYLLFSLIFLTGGSGWYTEDIIQKEKPFLFPAPLNHLHTLEAFTPSWFGAPQVLRARIFS